MHGWLEAAAPISGVGWAGLVLGALLLVLTLGLTIAGGAALLRGRLLRGASGLAGGLILLGGLGTAGALALGVLAYERLEQERPALALHFQQVEEQRYVARLAYPDGRTVSLPLAGDQWQVDARVLRWGGFAALLGLETRYRLERISGRYADLEAERTAPRSVHALAPEQRGIDPWLLAQRYGDRLPWVDAAYGSAAYLPMADGAEYRVVVTRSGLVARPANAEAEEAVRRW
ncbi:MAG: hypothetical protein ACLFMS_06935 [Halorhodospira sp.]